MSAVTTSTETVSPWMMGWNELERGQSSMITGRKHIPTWLFKLGGRLDKQYEEIVKALSDINAFNAGKKRDKALSLLSAWLPEAELFERFYCGDIARSEKGGHEQYSIL